MLITASATNIRTSPRKLSLVADLIRPLGLAQGLTTLKHLPKRAAGPLYKVLKQAQANAVHNQHLAQDKLTIKTIEINTGPTYKRFQAVSRGRGHSIKKRTSHIKIILEAVEAKPASTKVSARQSGPKN